MKNSCHYSAYVDSYAHGELDENGRLELENHLVSCADCRKELKYLRDLEVALNKSFDVQLDERFNYSVISDLRKVRAPQPAREIRIALEDIIVSLATLLVIVLIGIQLFHRPKISSEDMVGRLTNIERSSLEQTSLSNDQVLELVLRNK